MSSLRHAARLLGIALVTLGSALAQAASPAEAGLAVGRPAPEFELKDQAGRTNSLKTLLQEGKVALVFYRSADW